MKGLISVDFSFRPSAHMGFVGAAPGLRGLGDGLSDGLEGTPLHLDAPKTAARGQGQAGPTGLLGYSAVLRGSCAVSLQTSHCHQHSRPQSAQPALYRTKRGEAATTFEGE